MLYELLEKSRSYRGFDESRRITREELERMVACARLAPSAANIQPLKYYLAEDAETVAAIQPATRWAGALPELGLPYPGKRPVAFIVICQDTTIDSNIPKFQRDVGIVAQTMMLCAAEMGLGGCMIGSFSGAAIRETLNLPEHIVPLLVLGLGKPDENIVIVDVQPDGSTKYFRDAQGTHYVPKRTVEDMILNRK